MLDKDAVSYDWTPAATVRRVLYSGYFLSNTIEMVKCLPLRKFLAWSGRFLLLLLHMDEYNGFILLAVKDTICLIYFFVVYLWIFAGDLIQMWWQLSMSAIFLRYTMVQVISAGYKHLLWCWLNLFEKSRLILNVEIDYRCTWGLFQDNFVLILDFKHCLLNFQNMSNCMLHQVQILIKDTFLKTRKA